MKHIRTESGFSLFEILVVVGISAIALAGLFQIGHSVQIKNQTASTERMLSAIVNEATSYRKLNGSYAALNCDVSDPNCYFVSHNLIAQNQSNPFGGAVEILNQGDDQFIVNFQNVPSQACESLLLSMSDRSQLLQIELFNPDQARIGSSAPTEPPCPEGTTPGKDGVKGQATSPSGGIAGASDPKPPLGETCTVPGGYSVTSVQQFPIALADAAALCGSQPAYTMSWTFGS